MSNLGKQFKSLDPIFNVFSSAESQESTKCHRTAKKKKTYLSSGGLMVWASIMLNGRTPLLQLGKAWLSRMRCRDNVLVPYVHLFRDAVGPDLILMVYNSRLTRAHLVDLFPESKNIRLMASQVSKAKPYIEYILDALGKKNATRFSLSRNTQGLKTALLKVCD